MKPKLITMGGFLSCILYTGASAGEAPYRRAELVDFSETLPPRSDVGRIRSAMRIDFGEMVDASEEGPDFELRPHPRTGSLGIPRNRLRIPLWMLTGSSIGGAGTVPGNVASLGGCTARPYRPSNILGRGAERRRKILYPLAHQAACEADIPVGLFDALIVQESRYNPMAISPKGAFGLGQLMPATANELGVDRYSLQGNLRGAARYLGRQLREFGRVDLALAAYNAGPGRVRALRGVPKIAETRNYVRNVLANWAAIDSNASPLPEASHRSLSRLIWRGDFQTAPASVTQNDRAGSQTSNFPR